MPTPDVPAGWDSDAFDVWAAFDAATATGDPAPAPAAEQEGVASDPGVVDHGPLLSSAQRFASFIRGQLQGLGANSLPDPLNLIVAVASQPTAPEWVSTRRLAEVIGRITAGMDELAARRATELLGAEIARMTLLRSRKLPSSADKARPNGYQLEELRQRCQEYRDTA